MHECHGAGISPGELCWSCSELGALSTPREPGHSPALQGFSALKGVTPGDTRGSSLSLGATGAFDTKKGALVSSEVPNVQHTPGTTSLWDQQDQPLFW